MSPEGPQTIKAFVIIALLCMAAAAVLSLFPRGSKPGFAAAVCIVLLVAIFVSYGSPGTRRRVKLTDLLLMWAQWLHRVRELAVHQLHAVRQRVVSHRRSV